MAEIYQIQRNLSEDLVTKDSLNSCALISLSRIGLIQDEYFVIPVNARVIKVNDSPWPLYLIQCCRNGEDGVVNLFSIKQAWPEYITLPELVKKLSVGIEFTVHTECVTDGAKHTIHLK